MKCFQTVCGGDTLSRSSLFEWFKGFKGGHDGFSG
jgi:hypothetical protein